MANKEQLQELANTIKESISNSIKSAFQSVVIPADVNTLVQDISQSFETKNMSSLGTAIEKTNTLIEKVGFNLEKFGKGINETFKKYLEQKTVSEKQVEVMKEENILGQTELIENEIKTTTVNNKVLNERKEIVQREEEQLKLREDKLNPQELVSLQEDTEYNETREKLQKEKKSIQKTEQQNNAELGDVIDGNRMTEGGFHRLPEFLQGPVDMFTEALMAPVNIVKEIIGAFKNFGKAIIQTTKFIFGNLFKAFKGVFKIITNFGKIIKNLFKGIGTLIAGFSKLMNPIGLATIGLAGLGAFLAKDFLQEKLMKFLFGEEGVEAMLGEKLETKKVGVGIQNEMKVKMSKSKIEKEQAKLQDKVDKRVKQLSLKENQPGEEGGLTAFGRMWRKNELARQQKQLEFYTETLEKYEKLKQEEGIEGLGIQPPKDKDVSTGDELVGGVSSVTNTVVDNSQQHGGNIQVADQSVTIKKDSNNTDPSIWAAFGGGRTD